MLSYWIIRGWAKKKLLLRHIRVILPASDQDRISWGDYLFISQCHHRVDPHGSPRRNIGGGHGHSNEKSGSECAG
jgi:hypothetical protein